MNPSVHCLYCGAWQDWKRPHQEYVDVDFARVHFVCPDCGRHVDVWMTTDATRARLFGQNA